MNERLERIAATAPPAPSWFQLRPEDREPLPELLPLFYHCCDLHPKLPADDDVRAGLQAWLKDDPGVDPSALVPDSVSDEQASIAAAWEKDYLERKKNYRPLEYRRERERDEASARNEARRQARWAVIYAQVTIEELESHEKGTRPV